MQKVFYHLKILFHNICYLRIGEIDIVPIEKQIL